MFKNVSGQSIELLVVDVSLNKPLDGDSANLTLYVSADGDDPVELTNNDDIQEVDPVKSKGCYRIDLTKAESNANRLLFTGISSTTDAEVVPLLVYTKPLDAGAEGSVLVDHNYGGTDALRVVSTTAGGAGIDDVTIRAYLKSDYDAGNRSDDYLVEQTKTNVQGRWAQPMSLDPDTYTLVFSKQNDYGTKTSTLTVT